MLNPENVRFLRGNSILSNEKRRQVEQRMLHDKEFALLVERWQISFSHFNDDYQELPVNENIFGEIEKRLFGSTQDAGHTVSLWGSVTFWRWVSLATTIAAGVAIIFAFGGNLTSKNSGPLVAELSATDVRVNLLASYDPASGYLQVIPVVAGASGEKSLELWLVLQKGNPVSLGIFKPGKQGELTIPLELRDDITAGTTLAVSLEPFGGSPTGVPSGPIVASGIVRPL